MDKDYVDWIQSLKQKIQSVQIKASIAINEALILLYWDIGKSIAEKQNQFDWGAKVVERVAKDLKREIPNTNGFSRTNLFAMRKFYLFYKDAELMQQLGGLSVHKVPEADSEIVHQLGGRLTATNILCKIPWRHHVAILGKCNSTKQAQFYIEQIIQNNWSRNVLEIQIENRLIDRLGNSQNNFELTLPKPQSDLAKETLKDPYKFDFLTLEADVQEVHLEKSLTDNITQFLLELGKGFAFIGRQYAIQVGKKERKLDLLFYHTKMHCYMVIDLKMGEFEPEFAGKMNYYLSAVDQLLKTEHDNPSIRNHFM